MTQRMFMTVAMMSLVAVLGGCVSSDRFEAASQEVENQDDVIRKLRNELIEARRSRDDATNSLELSRLEVQQLSERLEGASDADALKSQLASLRTEMDELSRIESEGGIDGVEFSQRAEGTVMSVEGSVLFKLGSEDISDRGRTILDEIGRRLAALENSIRVEGHTDNSKVVKTIKRYPKGNLQLSGARALNVAAHLIGAGVTRARMSYAGFGAEHPVADNTTDEGRRRNRRVEIVVLKD